MSKWAVLLVCALAVGCGDAAEPTGSGDAQVSADTASEGGDAESSGDLDATTLSDATDVAGDDAEALTDTEEFPSDLPIITEIQEDVDLSEYFPDSVGPDGLHFAYALPGLFAILLALFFMLAPPLPQPGRRPRPHLPSNSCEAPPYAEPRGRRRSWRSRPPHPRPPHGPPREAGRRRPPCSRPGEIWGRYSRDRGEI